MLVYCPCIGFYNVAALVAISQIILRVAQRLVLFFEALPHKLWFEGNLLSMRLLTVFVK
jgi:hypothetical protein